MCENTLNKTCKETRSNHTQAHVHTEAHGVGGLKQRSQNPPIEHTLKENASQTSDVASTPCSNPMVMEHTQGRPKFSFYNLLASDS